MVGFSVYLGTTLNKTYIHKMTQLGYDMIFTSLQLSKLSLRQQLAYLGELCELLRNVNMTYVIDVHPDLLNHDFFTFFNNISTGNFIIRIDNQLQISMIEELQNHGLKCCLNASTIDASILQQLPTKQPIYYCHNYYPRPDTGLSTDFVSAQNHLIRQFDSNSIIFAFIPGSEFRGPLYCGLPTIEQHRTNNPLLAATQLMNSGINNNIISDPYMTAKHAEQLIFMLRDRHFKLKVTKLEHSYQQLLLQQHTSRPDAPEHVIRSSESRSRCQQHITSQPYPFDIRSCGHVTIDNHLNGRYEGEIQIVRTPLPTHSHVNYLATIVAEDQVLLPLIQPNDTFEFIEDKGVNQ